VGIPGIDASRGTSRGTLSLSLSGDLLFRTVYPPRKRSGLCRVRSCSRGAGQGERDSSALLYRRPMQQCGHFWSDRRLLEIQGSSSAAIRPKRNAGSCILVMLPAYSIPLSVSVPKTSVLCEEPELSSASKSAWKVLAEGIARDAACRARGLVLNDRPSTSTASCWLSRWTLSAWLFCIRADKLQFQLSCATMTPNSQYRTEDDHDQRRFPPRTLAQKPNPTHNSSATHKKTSKKHEAGGF
jgi:hypothetical protein